MKLLGWMHRKFRQGSGGEPLKDFSSGHPHQLDDIQCYPKASHYFTKSSSKSQRDNHHLLLRKSFAADSRAADEADHHGHYYDEDLQRDSSTAALSDLFHGFLAIGTLGGDHPLGDGGDPYATPAFSISVDNIAEKETGEVTESDLRMINDELEKVLLADGGGDQIASGRSSLVSNPRSSYCSTITLSGKQLESIEAAAGAATNICPLQGYLFGSAAIRVSETAAAANKKEPRPSLGELFQKTKMVDENSCGTGNKGENNKKENDKSSVHHLLKKILKKGMIHPSSSSKGSSTADNSAADTKFNKVLQMFHRKVHPESIAATEKLEKPSNKQNQLMYDNLLAGGGGEDVALVPKRRMSKDGGLRRLKSQSGLRHQFTAGGGDPNGNKECWIKSDADYSVLEL